MAVETHICNSAKTTSWLHSLRDKLNWRASSTGWSRSEKGLAKGFNRCLYLVASLNCCSQLMAASGSIQLYIYKKFTQLLSETEKSLHRWASLWQQFLICPSAGMGRIVSPLLILFSQTITKWFPCSIAKKDFCFSLLGASPFSVV